MSVELIKNIKSLTKIQLKQNRKMLVVAISALGLFVLISNLGLIINIDNQLPSFFENTTSELPQIFLALFLAIIIFTTTILTNNKISLYPSTSISRFVSRVLTDHIYMIIILVSSLLMYCIEYLILLVINEVRGDLLLVNAFDIKYALVGIINVMSCFLMVYGILILLCCVATKLGTLKTIILYSVIFIVWAMLIKGSIIEINGILNYFSKEEILGLFVLKTWCIWLISIILSFLVATRIKTMKEEVGGGWIIITIIIIFILIGTFGTFSTFSSSGTTTGSSWESYTAFGISRFQQLKKTYINKQTLVKCNNFDYNKFLKLQSSLDLYMLSETQALNGGIIDRKYSLNNEILVITLFPADKSNNQYIYQYYLDNMNISCEDSFMKYDFPNIKTVQNLFWGDSYKYLESYDLNDNKLLNTSGRNNNQMVYIITSDDLVKN